MGYLLYSLNRYLNAKVKFFLQFKKETLDIHQWVPAKKLGLNPGTGNSYASSEPIFLNAIFKTLPITKKDSILDYGCGKGGALITFNKFDFCLVGGVEISDSLCDIANKNLEQLGIENTLVYHKNAMEFYDIDSFNYFYFCNPFPGNVMSQVVKNIIDSYNRQKREITIIYYNPVYGHLFQSSDMFHKIATYKNILNHMLISIYSTDQSLHLKDNLITRFRRIV